MFAEACLTPAQLREGHLAEARLGVFAKPGENHRNVIAGMLIPRAGNDYAIAIDLLIFLWRLQCEGHLGPRRKRSRTAEFDAVFVEYDRMWRKRQAGLPRFDRDLLG